MLSIRTTKQAVMENIAAITTKGVIMTQTEIMSSLSRLNNDEVKEACQVLNARMEQITLGKMNQYQIGQKVQFDAHGELMTGIITKHNRKTFEVRVTDECYGERNFRVYHELVSSCMGRD